MQPTYPGSGMKVWVSIYFLQHSRPNLAISPCPGASTDCEQSSTLWPSDPTAFTIPNGNACGTPINRSEPNCITQDTYSPCTLMATNSDIQRTNTDIWIEHLCLLPTRIHGGLAETNWPCTWIASCRCLRMPCSSGSNVSNRKLGTEIPRTPKHYIVVSVKWCWRVVFHLQTTW